MKFSLSASYRTMMRSIEKKKKNFRNSVNKNSFSQMHQGEKLPRKCLPRAYRVGISNHIGELFRYRMLGEMRAFSSKPRVMAVYPQKTLFGIVRSHVFKIHRTAVSTTLYNNFVFVPFPTFSYTRTHLILIAYRIAAVNSSAINKRIKLTSIFSASSPF